MIAAAPALKLYFIISIFGNVGIFNELDISKKSQCEAFAESTLTQLNADIQRSSDEGIPFAFRGMEVKVGDITMECKVLSTPPVIDEYFDFEKRSKEKSQN